MATIGVSHWTRRDAADRMALGQAAFDVCKAQRDSGAVSDSRFYWAGPDTIVIQTVADGAGALNQPPNADVARGLFALADLAHQSRVEQWIDPRTGQEQYNLAGR